MTRKIRSDGRAIDVSARLPALEETLREVPGLAAGASRTAFTFSWV